MRGLFFRQRGLLALCLFALQGIPPLSLPTHRRDTCSVAA
jgi:hypothetical protein